MEEKKSISMNKKLEKAYAELIVKSGLNLKKGQSVIIKSNVDIEDFTALVVKQCYEAGAKYVHVLWQSEKVKYLNKYRKDKNRIANSKPNC